MDITEFARRGGKARAKSLTAKQRREIAAKGGTASKGKPRKKYKKRKKSAKKRQKR